VEALPILLARTHASTLMPGMVPADEEEFCMRLVVAGEACVDPARDSSPAGIAAATADARRRRRGQRLGYQLFLQAALFALLALYPAVFNCPFPSLHTNGLNAGRDDIQALMDVVLNAVRWMGASVNLDPDETVQWQLGGFCSVVEEEKLCLMVVQVLNPTLVDEQGREHPNFLLTGQLDSPFRRMLEALWNNPKLANRRRIAGVSMPLFSNIFDKTIQSGNKEAARRGLATCANPGCGNVESCPKAFQRCSRCHSAVYCSKTCQQAAWRVHKKECTRIAAARESAE